MKMKQEFLKFETFIVKDGSQVRLWEDRWLGNITLREHYPQLYNIAKEKHDTMADELNTHIPNISWRRDLIGNKLILWNNLLSRLEGIELRQGEMNLDGI